MGVTRLVISELKVNWTSVSIVPYWGGVLILIIIISYSLVLSLLVKRSIYCILESLFIDTLKSLGIAFEGIVPWRLGRSVIVLIGSNLSLVI